MDDWPTISVEGFHYMMSMSSKAALECLWRIRCGLGVLAGCGLRGASFWRTAGVPWPFGADRYMRKGNVWFATLKDIASHTRTLMAEGVWQPRVDRLPYYDGPIPELGSRPPERSV